MSLNAYAAKCHKASRDSGWWIDDLPPQQEGLVKATKLMLMVSEISEAMEGERKNLQDNHLPHRKSAEVEMVDLLIRAFDYCGRYGYDLDGAFEEKFQYNAQREDHKLETRAKAGGKAF